jgi:hypothetical protein
MAQTIKLKRSATQGATPATTALELGEVAINTYDGKMFIKKDDGTESIVEIGAGGVSDIVEDTTPQLGGDLDTNGNDINFGDNDKAIFGAGSDLQIYHDGSNSFITDVGTGDLAIRGNDLVLQNTTGQQYIRCTSDGAIDIGHSGFTKLSTLSTGIDVTGTVSADGLTAKHDTADQLQIGDTTDTNFWTLRAGTNLLFKDNGTERMRIDSSGRVGIGTSSPATSLHISSGTSGDAKLTLEADTDNNDEGDHPALHLKQDGGLINYRIGIGTSDGDVASSNNDLCVTAENLAASEMYMVNSSGTQYKFWHAGNDGSGSGLDADTVDGVHASGFLQATGATMTGNLALGDNVKIQIGDEPNLEIYHNGSHSFIEDIGGGSLYIRANPQVKLMVNGENGVWCQANSYTRLYHNNALKLETSTTGISVTGAVTSSGTGNGFYGNFLQQGDSGIYIDASYDAVIPYGSGANRDNALDLGRYNVRWDDVFATNGTIQTSDIREKQDIESLNDAEERVAVAAKGLLRKYRWKNRVAEKGDEARIHFGIMAQDLVAAFEAEGLDPSRYAMFTKSEWWEGDKVHPAIPEQLDEDGSILVEGKDEWVESNYAYDNQDDAPTDAVYHYRMGVRYSELLAFIIAAI